MMTMMMFLDASREDLCHSVESRMHHFRLSKIVYSKLFEYTILDNLGQVSPSPNFAVSGNTTKHGCTISPLCGIFLLFFYWFCSDVCRQIHLFFSPSLYLTMMN